MRKLAVATFAGILLVILGWQLLPSLLITLQIATLALAAAVIGGGGLAILCSLSRWAYCSSNGL